MGGPLELQEQRGLSFTTTPIAMVSYCLRVQGMIMTANRYRVSVHVTEQALTGNISRLLPLPSKLRIGSQTENVQFGLVITMPVRDAHPPGSLVKDERTIIQ